MGLYSPLETIERILELAVVPEFYQDIDHLTPEIIIELRQIAETAPAHPEDDSGVIGGLGLCHDDEERDIEARERYHLGMRKLHYRAARRLREHFFPNEPQPRFEPIRCIGEVLETETIEEGVVVFGDFEVMLIRRHPVFFMSPSGHKVATSLSSCYVDRECKKMTATGECRGENGLLLGRNVRSPIDVPPGSTLWVDRSGVDPNPPPPPISFPNDPP